MIGDISKEVPLIFIAKKEKVQIPVKTAHPFDKTHTITRYTDNRGDHWFDETGTSRMGEMSDNAALHGIDVTQKATDTYYRDSVENRKRAEAEYNRERYSYEVKLASPTHHTEAGEVRRRLQKVKYFEYFEQHRLAKLFGDAQVKQQASSTRR